MTLSSVIYYTGINPYTGENIFSAKKSKDRNEQRMFFFWYMQENRSIIKKILKRIGRSDIERKLFKE